MNVKRSPETMDIIVDAVASGMPFYCAAELAGIERNTITVWMKEDESFRLRMLQARATARSLAIKSVVTAAYTDPKIALEWLQRTYAEEFSPPSKLEHTGKDGGALEVNATARVLVMPPLANDADLRDDLETEQRADGVPPDGTPVDVPGEPR